jgi:chemotaxis protein MotB
MITGKQNRTINYDVDESSVWISISDLMSGLLIIFILTLTVYILNFTEKTYQISKNQILKEQILNDIKEQMKSKGFDIKIDDDQWVLRLENKVLFDSCGVDMKLLGRDTVKTLGKIIHSEFIKDDYKNSIETIFVEGHTDAAKIHKSDKCDFDSNWELSTQRAINTWKEMYKGEPRLTNLKNVNGAKLFSVSGYAQTRPLTNSWKEKARNRRIDIRIAMIPPAIKKKPKFVSNLKNSILKNNQPSTVKPVKNLKKSKLFKELEEVERIGEKSK